MINLYVEGRRIHGRNYDVMKQRHLFSLGYVAVIVALLSYSLFSFVQYRSDVQQSIAKNVNEDLKKYTSQSIDLFNYIMEDYFQQLEILAELCGKVSPEEQMHLLETIDGMNQGQAYVDFGIASKEGLLYDGEKIVDISDRDYFQHAMQGESYISKISRDSQNDRDYIVFSRPIVVDGEVRGIVASQYEIEAFMSLISNSQFDGKGTIMIMAEDGTMVSGYEGMEKYANLYEALGVDEFTYEDETTLQQFQENAEAGIAGFFRYRGSNGEYRYVYYQPVGRKDWTMISLVMAESLETQYEEIMNQSYVLMFKNGIVFICICICIALLYRKIKHVSIANQLDSLTGTYNKTSAQKICESYLKYTGKHKRHACFFLDIDDFKTINDTYGHDCGDQMIIDFSHRLQTLFRSSDVVSRFGGDEFFIFMKEIQDEHQIRKKAEEIGCLLREHQPSTTISIGISLYPKDGKKYTELLKHADEALYNVKKHKKDSYIFYQDIKK